MEEEEKRNVEESAAYFAWKRGDAPLGQEPPKYTPPDPDKPHPKSETLFDELLFDKDKLEPEPEKVDIDSVDTQDLSTEARERKMQAMTDELHGFSASQRIEAEQEEEERKKKAALQGRQIREQYGQRFEEVPPTQKRK